eukprot:11159186-Lingulodinium_polyedra.AAC.1
MCGTASTLLWNIGYDPIVHATQGPTYVDNLSGLIVGVRNALRFHLFLLVAGRAAGTAISTHKCTTIHADAVHPV